MIAHSPHNDEKISQDVMGRDLESREKSTESLDSASSSSSSCTLPVAQPTNDVALDDKITTSHDPTIAPLKIPKPDVPVTRRTTSSAGLFSPPIHGLTTDAELSAEAEPDLERVLTHLSYSAAPDGGYGWVNVILVFLINAHTWGLNSSYSIFLSHYLSSDVFPGATHLQYAFIGGLSVGCCFLVSPLVIVSIHSLGSKLTLLIGAIIQGGSLIAASFATEIWQLALSQGAGFGVGMSFLFVGSVGIVSQWFSTQRSLANGLATSGSGVGGLIYSLATSAMIRHLGQSWTFRILGLLAIVVNGICAVLVRDRYDVIGTPRRRLDTSLLKRPEYYLLLAFGWFSMLGYIVLLFSLASDARALGLSATQAATVAALFNLGQAVGRPLVGYFSDVTGRINMAACASLLGAVFALAIWTSATNYGLLVFFALVMGTVAGTFFATVSPLSAEVVGLGRVPSALNIVWLALVLPCTVSEAIGLETVNADGGSYVGASVFTGFMYVGAAFCLWVLRGWKIGEVERTNRRMSVDVGAVVVDAVTEKGVLSGAAIEEGGWRELVRNMMTWKKM